MVQEGRSEKGRRRRSSPVQVPRGSVPSPWNAVQGRVSEPVILDPGIPTRNGEALPAKSQLKKEITVGRMPPYAENLVRQNLVNGEELNLTMTMTEARIVPIPRLLLLQGDAGRFCVFFNVRCLKAARWTYLPRGPRFFGTNKYEHFNRLL
jgi:hypothetical protein